MPRDSLHLDEPVLEDALKVPYFFNGRLLSQEDLTHEQIAQRARNQQLGRALGSGIAYGLEVRHDAGASAPGNVVLQINPGLALSPAGDTLHLPELVRLRFSLRPESVTETAWPASDIFEDCRAATSALSLADPGLHLLVIRPFVGSEGLAAVSGLGNEAAACNTKYRTAGVSFRSVRLSSDVERNALFRSAFAAECFGFFDSGVPTDIAERPSSAGAPRYGLTDALRADKTLGSCEVPLAVLHLTNDGAVDFVDMWPVRRALVRPPLFGAWSLVGGTDERCRAEGEAAMLCFQEHVTDMLRETGLSSVTAKARFAFLPGGGFLPVGEGRFAPETFFGTSATAVRDADFGRLRALVEESWLCDPIDLSLPPPPLTYFVFAEAANRWVFFLRRRTDLAVAPAPNAEELRRAIDVAPAEDVVVSERWTSETGTLLAVLPPKSRVLASAGDLVLAREGRVTRMSPIEKAAAATLLAKDAPPKVRGGTAKPKKVTSLTELIPGARYYVAAKLPPGAYRLLGVKSAGTQPFVAENVTVTAGTVATVVVE